MNKTYARISGGLFAQTYITDDDSLKVIMATHDEDVFIESPFFGGSESLYYDGESVKRIPQSPDPSFRFNPVSMQWEDQRTLQDVRATQWDKIKKARASELNKPLMTPFGLIVMSGESRSNISEILINMLLDDNFTNVDFTMADNTTVTLNKNKMKQIGALVNNRVQQVYSSARSKREEISSADSKEKVMATDWSL